MGWFSEQIEQRKQHDAQALQDTFEQIARAVTGRQPMLPEEEGRTRDADAIAQVLHWFGIKPATAPEKIKDLNEQMDYMTRPCGVMRRGVKLEKGWHRDAIGPMLSRRRSDGALTALLPGRTRGYYFYDDDGNKVRVNSANEAGFENEAIVFYKPLPLKKLSVAGLLKYAAGTLSAADMAMLAIFMLVLTLIGMLEPRISKFLFSDILESGSVRLLTAIAMFSVSVTLSTAIIKASKSMLLARIETKMSMSVDAAAMMRILSLPASFFQDYSAGELAVRAGYVNTLCTKITSIVLSVGLTSVFSLAYVAQIFRFAPALTLPALGIIICTVALSIITTTIQVRISEKHMEHSAKEQGVSYAMIAGVQKIKLAGAEKRAFSKWGNIFAEGAALEYGPPKIVVLSGVVGTIISTVGMLIMYYMAVESGVSVANYYAFNSAYGMVSGAFFALTDIAGSIAQIRPVMQMARPIMDAVPEIAESRKMVEHLSGNIELSHVSFRYDENMPMVLDDLSLNIHRGEYVAVVGRTGCGKSTLVRLLLGFETPQKGAIYYDGRDMSALDMPSLRRNLGVVTQDGKLFYGNIYKNITIAAPWLTMQDAWDAAEIVGLADDIRSMPMGMNTMLSEGSGGISGGQKQRIMIARAIVSKPRILIMDEATSALDNITQKQVSTALDALDCTRIVIAHRLSTIRQCNRIIVLDGGRIIEDGTYDELIAANGFFAELVMRQKVE